MKSENEMAKTTITLGFSPCPNDTFMFDAIVNRRIDLQNINFIEKLEDVETLNRMAIDEKLDVTKLSFSAFSKVMDKYELLLSGSALGNGVGPLVVSREELSDPKNEIRSIAIPGNNTTAFFLFRIFYPENYIIKEMVFSDIEDAVLKGEVDAGLIIHESRFTYKDKGLFKVSDLGEQWENLTGQPIPLGGIAIRKTLDPNLKSQINSLVKQSVEYAFNNPSAGSSYVKKHSQEMSDEVISKHIGLYVNEYSVDLGLKGKKAISLFLEMSGQKDNRDIFVNLVESE